MGFFNRTAYLFSGAPVPECFLELEDVLAARFDLRYVTPYEEHAENVCRRLADSDYYLRQTEDSLQSDPILDAAVRVNTFLVAYFASAKALLDAVALSLAFLHDLGLAQKSTDLGKEHFWKVLKEADPAAAHKYKRYRALVGEVGKWRDAFIHRITPLVIVSGGRPSGQKGEVDFSGASVKMASAPDGTMRHYIRTHDNDSFLPVMELPSRIRKEMGHIACDVSGDLARSFELYSREHPRSPG